MQFNLIYNVAGEGLLASVSDEVPCDTEFARVSLRRETCMGSLRLAVASKGETLPEVQAQSNPRATSVARQIRKTEDWIAALERADIHLRGSSAELRCSVVIDDTAPQVEEDNALIQAASILVGAALNSLLGVKLPPPELG
jgi:hypothetical protein